MRLLLDSHVALWWLMGSSRLGNRALEYIAAADNTLLVSAATLWELGIKVSIRKLDADLRAIRSNLERHGVPILAVSADHAECATNLPVLHRDPFDHMLVAQATVENCVLLTRDKQLARYGAVVLYT